MVSALTSFNWNVTRVIGRMNKHGKEVLASGNDPLGDIDCMPQKHAFGKYFFVAVHVNVGLVVDPSELNP